MKQTAYLPTTSWFCLLTDRHCICIWPPLNITSMVSHIVWFCKLVSFGAQLLSELPAGILSLHFQSCVCIVEFNSYSWEIIIHRLILLMCLKNLRPDGTWCSLQYVVMTTVCVMFSSLWYLSCGCGYKVSHSRENTHHNSPMWWIQLYST